MDTINILPKAHKGSVGNIIEKALSSNGLNPFKGPDTKTAEIKSLGTKYNNSNMTISNMTLSTVSNDDINLEFLDTDIWHKMKSTLVCLYDYNTKVPHTIKHINKSLWFKYIDLIQSDWIMYQQFIYNYESFDIYKSQHVHGASDTLITGNILTFKRSFSSANKNKVRVSLTKRATTGFINEADELASLI